MQFVHGCAAGIGAQSTQKFDVKVAPGFRFRAYIVGADSSCKFPVTKDSSALSLPPNPAQMGV
jgi:hypothetical protein